MKALAVLFVSLLFVSCGERAPSVIGKWAEEDTPDVVHIEFFEDGKCLMDTGFNGTYQFLDDGRLKIDVMIFSFIADDVQVSENDMTYKHNGKPNRWIRK